jgi:hypothetical protein
MERPSPAPALTECQRGCTPQTLQRPYSRTQSVGVAFVPQLDARAAFRLVVERAARDRAADHGQHERAATCHACSVRAVPSTNRVTRVRYELARQSNVGGPHIRATRLRSHISSREDGP